MLDEFIAWYRSAYAFSNIKPEIIERNVAVIRDAFNSCHAGFVVSKSEVK